MGTLYANKLGSELPQAISGREATDPAAATTPTGLHALPEAQRAPIIHAYADALHGVVLWVVPVAILALVLAVFLPQVPMREAAKESASDPSEGFGMPEQGSSRVQLETIVGRILRRNGREDPAQRPGAYRPRDRCRDRMGPADRRHPITIPRRHRRPVVTRAAHRASGGRPDLVLRRYRRRRLPDPRRRCPDPDRYRQRRGGDTGPRLARLAGGAGPRLAARGLRRRQPHRRRHGHPRPYRPARARREQQPRGQARTRLRPDVVRLRWLCGGRFMPSSHRTQRVLARSSLRPQGSRRLVAEQADRFLSHRDFADLAGDGHRESLDDVYVPGILCRAILPAANSRTCSAVSPAAPSRNRIQAISSSP